MNAAVACVAPSASLGPRSVTSIVPPAELSLQSPLCDTTFAVSPPDAMSLNPEPPVNVTVCVVPVINVDGL